MLDDKRSAIRSVKECRGCVQGRRAHDVMAEFLSVAVKILGADDAKEALKEWSTIYRPKRKQFANDFVMDLASEMAPHLWWEAWGNDCPKLRILAMKVLAQVASSSACERFNSEAGHIMNIKQSAMLTRNMEDHLYVYHNLRILDNIELYDKLDEFYEWDADDEGSDDEEEGN